MTDLYVLVSFNMVFHNKAVFLSKLSSTQHKIFYFVHCGNREVPEGVFYVFGCILEMT